MFYGDVSVYYEFDVMCDVHALTGQWGQWLCGMMVGLRVRVGDCVQPRPE